MLIELYREEFTNLTGVDYSEHAIELASQIAKDQQMDIDYAVLNLLSQVDVEQRFGNQHFDIIHDKGTYDAISLHPDDPHEKRNTYISILHSMAAADGLLILTSCNWTESELCTALQGKFEKFKMIPTPTFRFGGSEGSVVTQIVFKKVPSHQ